MTHGGTDIVVIGLGNLFRGDDAVGLEVAQQISARRLPSVRVYAGLSDATALLELWIDADLCLVVDCAVSGSAAGTVHRFDGLADDIPSRFFSTFSTHAFSVTQGLALGRAMARLPRRLIVFGIEGTRFGCGEPISPIVRQAAIKVVETMADEIRRLTSGVTVE